MVQLLHSKTPVDRTLGARLLRNSENCNTIAILISALKIEKKLYPKIEICKTLVELGEESIQPLIDILGKVGKNQHKKVPKKEFKKDNYPLPRDIAGRTLIRFGETALLELDKVLDGHEEIKLSEAIDAIGYICFYHYNSIVYNKLLICYCRNNQTDLIKWKIIRAMSGFFESKVFLEEQKQILDNLRLNKEIDRSLRLINLRNNKN